jgi:hypothetical protein
MVHFSNFFWKICIADFLDGFNFILFLGPCHLVLGVSTIPIDSFLNQLSEGLALAYLKGREEAQTIFLNQVAIQNVLIIVDKTV